MNNTPLESLINNIAGQVDALIERLRLSPDEAIAALAGDAQARHVLARAVNQLDHLQTSIFTKIVVNGEMQAEPGAGAALLTTDADGDVGDKGEWATDVLDSNDLGQAAREKRRLQQMNTLLMEARQHERDQLAHRLHDLVGRNLTGLSLDISLIRLHLESLLPAEEIVAVLDDADRLVAEVGETTRDLIAEMRPPLLDDYGLVAAIEWYRGAFTQRTGIDVIIEQNAEFPRLSPAVENGLFRVVQESLNNMAKHAGAEQALVSLYADANTASIAIIDNGSGFDPNQRYGPTERPRWGLIFMRECITALGGRLNVESTIGEGTRIRVEVPR